MIIISERTERAAREIAVFHCGTPYMRYYLRICQNTPQLRWGDERLSLSPGACLREAASAKAGERVRVRGK
jgi:hypothetical protein